MKRLFFGCFCILYFSLLSAQTQKIHTVSRGETPESIATYYRITVEELQEANPSLDLSEYFYSGMKLIIPNNNTNNSGKGGKQKKDKKNDSVQDNKSETKAKRNDKTVSNSEFATSSADGNKAKNEKPVAVKSKRLTGSQFTSISLMIGGEGSNLTGGYYAIRGQYFRPSGFGATLTCASTYGISNPGDLIFKIGPSYVYSVAKWFYVEGTLAYTLTVANTNYNSGVVSGLSLIPEVGFSFGKLRLGVGLEGIWRNGGGVTGGLYLGVGYAFK